MSSTTLKHQASKDEAAMRTLIKSNQYLPPTVKTLLGGVAMGESPRWHEGRLWFCDWGKQEVVAVDLDGRSEVILRRQSFPFSIDWLPDGRLLLLSSRDGQLLRQEPDGPLVTHADLSRLSGRPWNELVVDARGRAYVNNIGFDFPGGEFAPGVVAVVTPNGEIRQVAGGVAFPNGMAITPDNSTLILAESYGNKLTAFDIDPDGNLTNRRTWADLPGDHPDGICLDTDGAVWYGDVGNKHCVRVGPGGEVLQTVELDRGCFACMLGGADRRTLFLIATDYSNPATLMSGRTGQVLTVPAPAPGAGRP
jgi:sugar lactone lactonase YvrE